MSGLGHVEFQGSETEDGAEGRRDPETDDDVGLGPAAQLEMMMKRCAEEDSSAP